MGCRFARRPGTHGPLVSRLSVALPTDAPLSVGGFPNCNLAISRDGRRIAYVAGGETNGRLYLRRLDDLAARALPETEGASNPFFSPDGEWIGFFSDDGKLKKVAQAGGRPVVLVRDLPNPYWMFGSWSDDGRLVFDTWSAGLRCVLAAGGPVTVLTTPSGEWQQDPHVLPGSDVVLYMAQVVSKLRIDAISLDAR